MSDNTDRHNYSHCKHHGPTGGNNWCARCPECRPQRKKVKP